MTEQKNSPVLRFPGFDSNWSKKRLKKIADINPKSKQNRPEQFNYIDLESVKQGRIINISKVSKDNAPSRAQRIAQKQDIFFQTVRPYQQNNFIYNFDVDDVVVSTGYAQFRTINHKYYIFTLLHTYRFLVNVLLNCTGSNYPAINSTDLSNIEVYITENKLEQEKIGNFFSKLDCQIELEEKKLELLEQQKRGYMQKIFSRELRLKDENGNLSPAWTQTQLKNITNRITRKNKKLESTRPLTISGQLGLIDQVEYFNKSVSSKNLENYTLLQKNEFAYNKSYSNGYPLGAIKRLTRYDKGVLSSLYICFSINSDISVDFMQYYFESTKWFREVASIAVEGARNHGLLNISVNDFFDINIKLPSLENQIKIADFLSKLDKLIEKQSAKVEILKQRKQGLLQKMFV